LPELVLIGRDASRLAEVQASIEALGTKAKATTDLEDIRQADIVLTVTSSVEPIIEPEHLKPGTVVCDVARPRNVSRRVVETRDDVLVIEGGIVDMPGDADFGFDFGFPPSQGYACMAETAILALEGRYECYTIGREISLSRVEEISGLGAKHGFRVSGFRSFERPVPEAYIEQVRAKARKARHAT
jgi:predicted amino acid dehydrogenase